MYRFHESLSLALERTRLRSATLQRGFVASLVDVGFDFQRGRASTQRRASQNPVPICPRQASRCEYKLTGNPPLGDSLKSLMEQDTSTQTVTVLPSRGAVQASSGRPATSAPKPTASRSTSASVKSTLPSKSAANAAKVPDKENELKEQVKLKPLPWDPTSVGTSAAKPQRRFEPNEARVPDAHNFFDNFLVYRGLKNVWRPRCGYAPPAREVWAASIAGMTGSFEFVLCLCMLSSCIFLVCYRANASCASKGWRFSRHGSSFA